MSEKPPIGEEIKKIQQQEFDDLDRLAKEIVTPSAQSADASEAPPIAPPETPPMPPVAAETKPAAGTAKTEPKFFSDVAQKRPQFSWEKDLAKPKTEPKPADVPPPVVPKPDAEPVVPKPEDIRQAELNQVIIDFQAKQSQIAETRAKKTGRFASLAKSLGIKTKNLSEDPEVMGMEKESHDLYRNLLSKGINLYKGDKPQLENFLKQFDEFEVFRTSYNQEMDKRAELAKWPESVLAGFHRIGKRWSELKTWQKIAVGAAGGLAIAGGALALGAGTFGAAALGAGWRWGFRGFGAISAGIGRNILLDKKMMEGIDQTSEERLVEKMELLQDYENNLDAGIAAIVNSGKIADARKSFEEKNLENTKKVVNLVVWSFIISSIIGESLRESGISFGGVVKKIGGYVGMGGGGAATQAQEVLATHTPDVKTGGGLMGYGTESEGHVNEFDEKYGPEKYGTEGEGHISEPTTISDMRAPDAPPKIAELGIREISPVKIGEGGTMWGSVEDHIKANPSAYGLDPNDANFTKDMRKMTQQMLNEFASRKGLSYEQLNQIARTKLRAGDSFKIMFDSSNNDLYIDDFHGKAFGANVSQSVPVEEIASNKPPASPAGENMAVEDVKPKTGASVAPDHQPSRGAGKTMQYDSDTPDQKIAKEDFVKADQYQKDTRAYNIQETARLETANEVTNSRLYLSTRGLLNQLVNGAGVGDKANFWQHLMDDWGKLLGSENYMAQDIQLADEARVASFDKLKSLYPILERYHKQGFKTIGDCLKEAVKDPKILLMINEIVLRK